MLKSVDRFNSLKVAIVFAIASILLMVGAEIIQHRSFSSSSTIVTSAEKKLSKLQKDMLSSLETIESLKTEEEFHNFFLHSGLSENGFSYYIINNNKIIYWSDNEPVVYGDDLTFDGQGKFLSLPNGDFLVYSIKHDNKKFIGLILLRHNYDYENKYLVNEFNSNLGLTSAFTASGEGPLDFHLPDGSIGYHLSYENANETNGNCAIWFYLFAILFGLTSLYLILRNAFRKSYLNGFAIVALLWGLRTLMIAYKIPDELYRLPIFSPQYYASSFYFNSLGDFLLNSFFFFLVVINIYDVCTKIKSTAITVLGAIVVLIGLVLGFHFLITGLIINSQISFDINTPLEMSQFSIWAFVAISVLLITFLFCTAILLRLISGYRVTAGHAWIGIALCALYSSVVLNELNCFKEQESRKLLAQKIGARRDHVAEYLFDEVGKKMQNDTLIAEMAEKKESIVPYISQKYLNGYLARFENNISVFPVNDSSLVVDGKTLNYFQQLADNGRPTFGRNLVFLSSENGRSSYLAFVPLGNPLTAKYTVVILMNARFLQTQEGFPELFMSGQSQENTFPKEYSFARYSGTSLIYEYGNYTYSLTNKDFKNYTDEFSFVDLNGFSHLIYHLNANDLIVVSRQKESVFMLLTLFSWMFAFSGITAFVVYILSFVFSSRMNFSWNLMRRIQISVVLVVVLSFILVGAGTVVYIDKKYQSDERKSISDQVNALWFMISENAAPYLSSENYSEMVDVLSKIVNNTNIDFNLFNANGELLYSSQPKIYNQNIVSKRMNPEALFEIKKNQLTQFINPENAGKLNYIAGYAPITNRNGDVKAYLSLPYFEKQNELNKEVSGFLSALLNIYVFLLAIAVLVTVIISSRITKPLLLIQEKMSGVRLGMVNEKIAYQRNDEIGQLVHEYNRMLEELASSANKLAQSERESAWREMAKQVAHEIKNPLTPMKLSVQHLQRTLQHKDEKDKEFVNRISDTLIQQIDTLSAIATSFSDFAKMPQSHPEKLNLINLIKPIADLYSELPNLKIQILNPDQGLFVMADKDYLNRVFSNILKNAMQAIPDDRSGMITIDIKKMSNDVLIEISDNGSGIPDNKREMIFVPNFTTKSSGMGLGLAIVKNLVEQCGGKVWFTSTVDVGTTFSIQLPKA